MKLNKITLVCLVLLGLSPIVAVTGEYLNTSTDYTSNTIGDPVGISAGYTLKYTIDKLELPEIIENVTIPDLAGNTVYVKVMSVSDDFSFINYGVGVILNNDETFEIGEGYPALTITLPAGSATPAIILGGTPHFNVGSLLDVSIFFLNSNWTEHETILEFMGFTVENDATEFTVSLTNNTGTLSSTWRKSDGVLTHIALDKIFFMNLNFTEVSVEFSLASSELKGIDVEIGDEISLTANIASLDISGTGDIFTMIDQSLISEYENNVSALLDNELLKFTVVDVEGLYIKCGIEAYDYNTKSLVSLDGEYVFNAFLGAFDMGGYPPFTEISPNVKGINPSFVPSYTYIPAISPIITADWDIYSGMMVLADTFVNIYLQTILDFLTPSGFEGLSINEIDGNFYLSENKGYRYFRETFSIDLTAAITPTLYEMVPQVSLYLDIAAIAEEEAWVAFANDGFLAGMRIKTDITIEITSDYGTSISGLPTGTITIKSDIKLVNPNYNPPDPLAGGIIPGFTWLIAIPTLIGLAALGLVARRK